MRYGNSSLDGNGTQSGESRGSLTTGVTENLCQGKRLQILARNTRRFDLEMSGKVTWKEEKGNVKEK